MHPGINDLCEVMDASSSVNTSVIYKKLESQESQMNLPGQVQKADTDASKLNQKEDVKIIEDCRQYRQISVQMLENFETIWDGPFGGTNVAKHCIELETPSRRSVQSTSYRAELEERDFRKQEVERMLAGKVIEPA